jgi:PAS domain S-box-containing protein
MRNVISPFRVDGQIRGILGFNFDITALKEAEAAFKEKQVLLQAILDYSPTLISIKDLEGKVILANRNFAVLDLPPLHELVGRNVFELFPEEVARELWQNDLAAVKAGGPIESEEIVKHKDGQWHTYLTVKFPVYREEGRALGTCAISTDITERKEALQAMRDARNQLEQRVAERTAELAHANQRLTAEIAERALLQEELVAAGDRERHRVGQNLHDGLCQILTAARYKTDSLLTRLEAGSPIEEKARSIAELVAQAVDEARCMARGLEPVEPLPEGLMAALQQLAAATSRLFNVSCECEYPEPVLVSDHQAVLRRRPRTTGSSTARPAPFASGWLRKQRRPF